MCKNLVPRGYESSVQGRLQKRGRMGFRQLLVSPYFYQRLFLKSVKCKRIEGAGQVSGTA